MTNYAGSYSQNPATAGALIGSHPPEVTGWSQSKDGQDHFTKTFMDQKNAQQPWANAGKTVLDYSRSYSYSSDNSALGAEADAGLFINGAPTTIYGAGGLGTDDPLVWKAAVDSGNFVLADALAQSDETKSISYLETTYDHSYDGYGTTRGVYTGWNQSDIQAPVAKGWNRNYDGVALDPISARMSVTQADVATRASTCRSGEQAGPVVEAGHGSSAQPYSFGGRAGRNSIPSTRRPEISKARIRRTIRSPITRAAITPTPPNWGGIVQDHPPVVQSYGYSRDNQEQSSREPTSTRPT